VSSREAIIELGVAPLSVRQVGEVAAGRARLALSADPGYRARLEASRASLERQLAAGRTIYGVTTGVGESCENVVPVVTP